MGPFAVKSSGFYADLLPGLRGFWQPPRPPREGDARDSSDHGRARRGNGRGTASCPHEFRTGPRLPRPVQRGAARCGSGRGRRPRRTAPDPVLESLLRGVLRVRDPRRGPRTGPLRAPPARRRRGLPRRSSVSRRPDGPLRGPGRGPRSRGGRGPPGGLSRARPGLGHGGRALSEDPALDPLPPRLSRRGRGRRGRARREVDRTGKARRADVRPRGAFREAPGEPAAGGSACWMPPCAFKERTPG